MATSGSTYSSSQNLTGSAPTLSTDGQAIRDLAAITVILETATPASQTLAGGGTLKCYIYDAADQGPGAWSRCPDLDLTVPSGASGEARVAFQAIQVIGPRAARIKWIPSSVTVSAGTTVTVYQLGHANRLVNGGAQ